MSLLENIEADRTQARRDNQTPLASFLGFVIAEGRAIGKNAKPPRDSTDEEVIGALRKIIASNEETLRLTGQHGLTDQNAIWQNKILNNYLPTQLSDADVERLIREFVNSQNWTDEQKTPKMLGSVMSMLKECYPGQYNPKRASEITRKILSE